MLPPDSALIRPARSIRLVSLAGLLAAIALVFAQTWQFEFLSWDDPMYVTGNPQIMSGLSLDNLFWAFETRHFGLWTPLTWISHMTDVSIWGRNAGGHHLTSVVLHASAALLLYGFLYEATGAHWRSLLVSLLFAVHPLHVESVAWVSERKDVLVAVFFFATLLLYARWARSGRFGFLLLTYLAALLAGLSKPMAVSLPVVMILTDIWPLRRFDFSGRPWLSLRQSIVEKWPFIVAAALLAFFTLNEATGTNMQPVKPEELIRLADRLQIAGAAYGVYVWKMVWPIALSFYYPLDLPYPAWRYLAPPMLLTGLLILAWRHRQRSPFLLVGLAWYALTLLPVSGIIQIGYYAYADRYSYLPLTGLFIGLVWLAPAWPRQGWQQTLAWCGSGLLVALLLAGTHWQTSHWRDSLSLYQRAVEIDPGNRMARLALGDTHAKRQQYSQAIPHLQAVVGQQTADTLSAMAQSLLGDIAYFQGRPADAINAWMMAANMDTLNFRPRLRLGTIALQEGRIDAAILYLTEADRLMPFHIDVLNNLGVAYVRHGDDRRALDAYQRAVTGNKLDRTARLNLARTYERLGDRQAALENYAAMLEYFPDDPAARNGLARLGP